MVRLQVWLDRQGFGPGKIDGKGGEFTSKALTFLKAAHPEAGMDLPPADFTELTYTEHVVSDASLQHVGNLPPTPEEQSQQKSLPYPTLLELIAERYHADTDLLAALNPGKDLTALQPGDRIKVPNVVPFEIEKVRKEERRKPSAKSPTRSVEVTVDERMLRVREQDKVIAAFPLTAGSDHLPAPPGEWKVESIVTLPFFRRDEQLLKEGTRGEEALTLPPGPRNPVGVVWMALNKDGIGIHGTDNPWTIGRSVSHGCIRLANWDVLKLSVLLQPGTAVSIR